MTTVMKTDPGLAVFPSWGNVANTFQRHFEHYWQHGSGENAVVGLRAEGSVTLQYAGRVVYELFQNEGRPGFMSNPRKHLLTDGFIIQNLA